eukprot:gene11017-14796_t
MSTELQKQLNLARSKQIQPRSVNDGEPSLFLTEKEASRLDLQDIYQAAVTGINILIQYDERFESFSQNVLHPSSMEIQRELRTKEENSKLDAELTKLFRLLCLYALEQPTHLILEYLIRRLRVHELNSELLISSMIVIHDSKLFGKIVQLSKIEGTMWNFLSNIKKTGSPLPRSVIVQVCLKNRLFLDTICKSVKIALEESLSVTSNKSKTIMNKGANQMISFFTSVVIEMAEVHSFEDSEIRSLFSYLTEGLKIKFTTSENPEIAKQWKKSVCMIICQICRRTTLAQPLLKSITQLLADSYNNILYEDNQKVLSNEKLQEINEIIQTLIIISQHQKIVLSNKFLKKMFELSFVKGDDNIKGEITFIKQMKLLNERVELDQLIKAILAGILSSIIEPISNHEDEEDKMIYLIKYYSNILIQLISSDILSLHIIEILINAVFINIIPLLRPTQSLSIITSVQDIIKILAQRFPTVFEVTVSATIENMKSNPDSTINTTIGNVTIQSSKFNVSILRDFIKSTFFESSSLMHIPNETGAGLYLSLNSSIPIVRMNALEQFGSQNLLDCESTNDVQGLAQAVLQNMCDDSIEVAIFAWKPEILCRVILHSSSADFTNALKYATSLWMSHMVNALVENGFKFVDNLLKSLNDETVVDTLFTKWLEANENSDKLWIFSFLLKIAFDFIPLCLSAVDESLLKKFENELQSTKKNAYKVLVRISNHSECKEVFSFLSIMKKSKHSIEESLVESLSSDKIINNNSNNPIMQLINMLIDNSNHTPTIPNTLGEALATLTFTTKLLSSFAENLKYDRLISSINQLCGEVVINIINFYQQTPIIGHSSFVKSLETFLNISVKSSANKIYAYNESNLNNYNALVDSCSEQFNQFDVNERIILSILDSSNRSILSMLGPNLLILYGNKSYVFLFKVIINYILECSGSVGSYNHSTENIVISSNIAAISIQALSSLLSSLYNTNLDSELSIFVLLLFPIIIRLLSDDADTVRKSSLSLAQQMFDLLSNKTMKLPKQQIDSLATFNDKFSKQDSSDFIRSTIIEVITILSERQDDILMDPLICSNILSSYIVSQSETLKSDYLLWSTTVYSWKLPSVSYFIVNAYSSSTINQLDESSLARLWKYVEIIVNLLIEYQENLLLNDCNKLTKKLLYYIPSIFNKISSNLQSDIIIWLSNNIKSLPTLSESYLQIIRDNCMKVIIDMKGFPEVDQELRVILYTSLLSEQIKRSGNKEILSAIELIKIPIEVPFHALQQGVIEFNSQFSNHNNDILTEADNDDVTSNPLEITGVSIPVQKLCYLIEGIIITLQKYHSKINNNNNLDLETHDILSLKKMAVLLFELLSVIFQQVMKSLMMLDYCKTIILELAYHCLQIAFISNPIPLVTIPTTAKKAKKGVSELSENNDYVIAARVGNDISNTLHYLSKTKSIQVTSAGLKLLGVLIQLDSKQLLPSISILSKLLSTTTTELYMKMSHGNSVAESILITLSKSVFGNNANTTINETEMMLIKQEILFSLCLYFQQIPHFRRGSLVNMTIHTLGLDSLSTILSILLVHTYVSYEICDFTYNNNNLSNLSTRDNKQLTNISNNQIILLSKSAHKKAFKESKISQPEEFFNLTVNLLVNQQDPSIILDNLMSLLKLSIECLSSTLHIENDTNQFQISSKLMSYCSTLINDVYNNNNNNNNNRIIPSNDSNGFTLIFLHLQYISDLLENKDFHNILLEIDENKPNYDLSIKTQNSFLHLIDMILQLLAIVSSVEEGYEHNNDKIQLYSIRVENELINITSKGIASSISQWCYDNIHAIQRLVDLPSFISILQELIQHEKIEVRQKALIILGQRLDTISTQKKLGNDDEMSLFLDLNNNLRELVNNLLPSIATVYPINSNIKQQIALGQSSLMCIEVLANYLSKFKDFQKDIEETLKDTMLLIEKLMIKEVKSNDLVIRNEKKTPKKSKSNQLQVENQQNNTQEVVNLENLKLLGSSFLCSSKLCGLLHGDSLLQLSALMSHLFESLQDHSSLLLDSSKHAYMSDPVTNRTISLFIRSIINSLTIICKSLPTFFHPFIQQTLILVLPLYNISSSLSADTLLITEDIDRLLSILSSKVPSRLSVPVIISSNSKLLSLESFEAIKKYLLFLGELCQNLDRSIVKQEMTNLTKLSIQCLDYRRVYGSNFIAEIRDEIDIIISNSIVELCLKLTESELKIILLKMMEWKDITMEESEERGEGDSWKLYARSISYYQLLYALGSKLQAIFVPLLSSMWTNFSNQLVNNNMLFNNAIKIKKSSFHNNNTFESIEKKRKSQLNDNNNDNNNSDGGCHELIKLFKLMFDCLSLCCENDTSNTFIDETRYEQVLSPIINVMFLHDGFESDMEYRECALNHYIPCIVNLAIAINKDNMWKPLNHKVLLAMRHNKKSVQIIAVKTLHQLFCQ